MEILAHNQVRITRYPAILEALYFNPQAPMATVAAVLETCVRQGVDISHIPGHDEIVDSILGEVATPPAEEAEDAEEGDEPRGGITDSEFQELLMGAAASEGDSAKDEDAFDEHRPLNLSAMQKMTVSQKVRLALVGNQSVRKLLIRDRDRVVQRAVLQSPRLNEKEIAAFARNKSLPDTIIRTIATRRDWVKNINVKTALVFNPKCPPEFAIRFIPSLSPRALKELSKSKEVPSYVMHAARRILLARDKVRGAKR